MRKYSPLLLSLPMKLTLPPNRAFVHVYAQSQVANPEKRSMTAVALVMAGSFGGVAGSTIFRSQDAPKYLPGMW